MHEPLLGPPPFPRLIDYFGAWLIEPQAAAAFWSAASTMDWSKHMALAPAPPRGSTTEVVVKNDKKVAVVRAGGLLMKQQSSMGGTSTVQMRREIRAAAADPAVSSILLAIDSPGGTVAGTADLAADVKAARRQKPVWAFIEDMGASAAYWVASQADAVYANTPTALVGSIGTVLAIADSSDAAEKVGVKPLVFATGPLKGAGMPGTKVTDEQRVYFQRLVDETQTHFDAAVRSGRGLKAAELAAVKTGGAFGAEEAVTLRLIDGIKPMAWVIDQLVVAK